MANGISFNTLAYAKKLIAAGVPSNQAEALAEIIDQRIVTNQELKELESRITASIIKWVAGMLVAQAAIVATLVKLL